MIAIEEIKNDYMKRRKRKSVFLKCSGHLRVEEKFLLFECVW